MASYRRRLFSTGCVLAAVAVACGRSDDTPAQLASVIGSDTYELASDPSVLTDVSLTDKTGQTTIVTPSYLPKPGQIARDLQIIFYPRLTVKNPRFVYDRSKWTVAVGNNVQFLTAADIIEIKEDGNFSSGEVREGQIKMTVRLTAQGQWPDKITNDAALTTIDGRKALKLQPYYSLDGAVAPGNSGTVQGLSAAYMKDDVGAIVAPARINSSAITDGAFSIEFSAPDDTTAADTSSGSVTFVGKSNVSGFVVVYWKDSECRGSGWTFKPNKVFDRTAANSDLNCTYPGLDTAISGSNSCNLGCSTDVGDSFFGKAANDIAVPPEFPTETGADNAIKRGCLNIVRVASDGRTSFAVNNATNGGTYGAMVYPLDSSGGLGMTRSRCSKLEPFNVEFASTRKSPGLGKSKSDCFVATAASGSSQSKSVHYWRILRDTWLDRLGLSSVYYRYAPSWAAWLEDNPAYKPTVNAALEWSGRNLVKLSQWMHRFGESMDSSMQNISLFLSKLVGSEARADTSVPQTDNSGLKHPRGSAFTTLTIGGGQIRPSADKDLYDLSYKDKKPAFLFVGQTFRLVDLSGELGLGYEFTGLSMKGTSSDTPKTPVSLGGYGGGITGEYRLRIGAYPWVAPRISGVYGMMRMREEAEAVSSDTSSSSGTSDISPSGTTPVWQRYTTFRFFLDVSIPRLYGDDENLIRYGYQVEDMTLSFFGGLNTNDGKIISTSGLQLGGAISFMFH
ncbi:MAG: hypothetical protein FJY29_11145 [Betaproteobacteria bacterium]|nr:hypothetical protein [Betaproteobacteria bacterium]